MTVSTAPAPMQSGPSRAISSALECMRKGGKLGGIRFAVAVYADGTGKSSFGFEGATGSFLPQGTTAMWAAQSVMMAGGQAMNCYELNTERAIRQFGGAGVEKMMTERLDNAAPTGWIPGCVV